MHAVTLICSPQYNCQPGVAWDAAFFRSHKISRTIHGFPIEPRAVFFHQIESIHKTKVDLNRFDSKYVLRWYGPLALGVAPSLAVFNHVEIWYISLSWHHRSSCQSIRQSTTQSILIFITLCLPSDSSVQHDLQHWSLINIPRKKKTKLNPNKGNLCTKSNPLLFSVRTDFRLNLYLLQLLAINQSASQRLQVGIRCCKTAQTLLISLR